MNTLQTQFNELQEDLLMVGYHFEAISSVQNYPNTYQDGKNSCYMRCPTCGSRPKDRFDVEYMSEDNECLNCDDRRSDV